MTAISPTSSATGAGDVMAAGCSPRLAASTAALICWLWRRSSAQRFSAIASARRPRGLPSMSVFLSAGVVPPGGAPPTAAASGASARSAVVQGLAPVGGGVVPPPVPDPPLLEPPPPPHAARSTDRHSAVDRAWVRDIQVTAVNGGAGTPEARIPGLPQQPRDPV